MFINILSYKLISKLGSHPGSGKRFLLCKKNKHGLLITDDSLLPLEIEMASGDNDCINLVEMKFTDNTLYFIAEDDENLESDYFGKITSSISIIRNLKDQVLFINRGKQPVFEDMPDSDCTDNAPQTRFIIYLYKDSDARGMAIAISVKCEKLFTLSCENKVISFKETNPPDEIPETKSDVIFFQRSVPGHEDKMQFESSLYEGYFLACIKEKDQYKLILKKSGENGDNSVMFTVQNQD